MDKESFGVNRHFLHFLSKMNFKPYFFSFLVTLACGKEQEFIHSRLPNAIAVVGRSFQYFLSPQVDLPNTFKVCLAFAAPILSKK